MYQDILNKIKEYNTITIFRHENPDGDAVGSQLALKYWIKDNFQEKSVFAMGFGVYDIYPEIDKVSDEIIKDSLAIIVDTANLPRVDDQRYALAKEIIKIDHHPDVDSFGLPRVVDPKASSTCQIITNILFSYADFKVSDKVAEFLYSGLLTDTLSFKTSNTTKSTFEAASMLLTKNINPSVISDRVFCIDYKQFKIANYIRDNHIYENNIAYVLIDKTTREKLCVSASDIRNRVSELGGVKDFKIWAIFTEGDDGNWRGSLRSRGIVINKIAEQFHGGGHPNACGTTLADKDEIYLLIKSLKELIIE